jgi:hypothetical protein
MIENPITDRPPQANEPVSPAAAGGKDLLGVRIAAALIDFAALLALFVVLAILIGETSWGGGTFSFYLSGAELALYAALVLLYYFVLEAAIGQTVGKLLLNVRVVRSDGSRPLDGTIQAGPEEITMAGKPGLRYKATGTVDGTPIESTIVVAFDGTIEYFFNCQYTQENSAEITQGCDQIMRTFKLDQQGT